MYITMDPDGLYSFKVISNPNLQVFSTYTSFLRVLPQSISNDFGFNLEQFVIICIADRLSSSFFNEL